LSRFSGSQTRLRRAAERFLAPGGRDSFAARLLRCLLSPLALVYCAVQKGRVELYRRGVLSRRRLPCAVVSIGNITVGGSGKTPFTIWLARRCLEHSMRVIVLARGYGGRGAKRPAVLLGPQAAPHSPALYGDEPVLVASALGSVPVAVCKDRYAAGIAALERHEAEIVLLDDGFQHLRLARSVDIVLVPSAETLQRARVLPAGMLREPLSALKRADFIVVTDPADTPAGDGIADRELKWFRRFNASAPIFRAVAEAKRIYDVFSGEAYETADLMGKTLLALCGIGRPERFFRGLERLGLALSGRLVFPDHHRYGSRDIAEVSGRLGSFDYAVTTEKDAVKLRHYEALRGRLLAVEVSLGVAEEDEFWSSLEARLRAGEAGQRCP